MSGWNPPPGQGGPYGGPPGPGPQPGFGPQPPGGPMPPYGQQQPPPYGGPQPGWGGPGTPPPFPPPPPPRRGSGAGLIVLLGGGILAVLLIVVVVVVAVSAGGGPSSISTPPTAGGLSRNYSAESELGSQISSQRSLLQRSAGYRLDDVKSAVYGSGTQRYLFIGGTGDVESGDEFVANFRRSATSSSSSLVNTTVTELSDPGGDGVGVCAEIRASTGGSSSTSALCAWATDKTFGMILPAPDGTSLTNRPDFSASDVAETMRRIRDDVED